MKKFKEVSKTKKFIYGAMFVAVSIIGAVSIFAVKGQVFQEYDELWEDDNCIMSGEDGYDDGELSPEWKKNRIRECMNIRNKVAQIKYGMPLFIAMFFLGILLMGFSFLDIKSSADRIVEEFEKGEEDNSDNKLS